MPEETAGAGASTSRPQIPLLDNAGEYGRLYNYVKAVRELLGKGGEAYRRVKTQHPDIDSKIDSGNLRVINDIIFENSNLVGLGGIKREELAKIANYSKVLANAERSGNKIPSLNAVNNVKADYDNIMQEKLEQGRDSYQESKDKLKEIRKEKNKKNGKVVSRVVFGMLAAALALGLVAGFGLGVYGIVQTAMAASFTITSGFAVGGVAVALIAGRAIVKGLGALFRKISSSFKKANAERKEAKAKFKAAKREMNQNRRNDLSNQYALARDNESELISPYPGSEGISTISRSREATVDMVSASELSAISGEFAAERAAREAAAREAEARRAAAEHTAAAASEYSDEETLGREPVSETGAPVSPEREASERAAREAAEREAAERAAREAAEREAAERAAREAAEREAAERAAREAAERAAREAAERAAREAAERAARETAERAAREAAEREAAERAAREAAERAAREAAERAAREAAEREAAEPLTPMQEFENKYGSDMVRAIEGSYNLHFKPSGRTATTIKKEDMAPAYSALLNDVASSVRMGDTKSELSVNVPVMIDDYLKARGVEISRKKTEDPAIKVEDSHVAVESEEAPAKTDEDMVKDLLKSYKGKTLAPSTIMKKLKVDGPKARDLAEMYKKARAEERTSKEAEEAPKAPVVKAPVVKEKKPATPETLKEKLEAAAAGGRTDDEIVADMIKKWSGTYGSTDRIIAKIQREYGFTFVKASRLQKKYQEEMRKREAEAASLKASAPEETAEVPVDKAPETPKTEPEAPAAGMTTDDEIVADMIKKWSGTYGSTDRIIAKIQREYMVGFVKASRLQEKYQEEMRKREAEAASLKASAPEETAKGPTPSVAKEPEKKEATEEVAKEVAEEVAEEVAAPIPESDEVYAEAEPEDDGWQELTENALKAGVPEELLSSMRERGMSAEDAYNTLKKDFTIAADKDGDAKKEDSDEPGSGA